tara:strand:- start:355 stop:549 length:195 start_codon:yes stop_codon:yes gene_type:complete
MNTTAIATLNIRLLLHIFFFFTCDEPTVIGKPSPLLEEGTTLVVDDVERAPLVVVAAAPGLTFV